MRYAFSILLGLLVGTFPALHLKGQSLSVAQADSLQLLLRVSKADTNRVHQLIRLGEYQVYKLGEAKTDMDSARTYAQQALGLSRRLGFYNGEARSLNLLGTISRESRQFHQSIGYHLAANRLYQQHRDWQGEADSYLLLAWTKRDAGNAEKGRTDLQKAITLYKGKGYYKGVAQAYIELGNSYLYWGNQLDTKIIQYQQALLWFTRAGDIKGQADVHKDLGDLYQVKGNLALALLEIRQALTLYQSIHYPRLQGVYDLLGNVSTALGDYQEAVRYGLKAVQTAEAVKDTTIQLCTIYNRLGLCYFYSRQYRKAHGYYKKAMLVAQKYNDRPSIIILTGNIANILVATGQMKASVQLLLNTAKRYPPQRMSDSISLVYPLLRIYTQMKQFTLAQGYCNQLLSILSRSGKDNDDLDPIYRGIIPFFIFSKQHGQARKYLAAYENYCTIRKYLIRLPYVHLYKFQLDSMQANYPSAIRHYQQYKLLQDSLLNETKSQQIATLDVLYETEKKERDLKLKEQNIALLREQNKAQEATIGQQQTQRNAFIGGTLLLAALLGLSYNRFRLKQRSNQLLQQQQQLIHHKNQDLQRLLTEQERLLKEIHHRVKNNLQIVMSLLNSQAASLKDQAALSAIQESQHRVQAMALIHQKLYQTEGVARIRMADYLAELVAYLQESYELAQPIRFELAIESIELDVTQAVPLGLIINEAITNALKYAFPDGRSGVVQVKLSEPSAGGYALVVADNGVGLPADFDPARSRSLGMTLMYGFSEQLGGHLQISGQPGLSIRLSFQDETNTVHA